MKKKHKRLLSFLIFLGIFWGFSFFTIQSFKENMEYYLTPEQILKLETIDKKKIRIGGLVVSISKEDYITKFTITDFTHQVTIIYEGNDFPPIFKENIGIIARGNLIDKDTFRADQIIGKHDENYMPKLKK